MTDRRPGRFRLLLTVAISVCMAFAGLGLGSTGDRADAAAPQPNVIIIITDDQPQGTIDVMPRLQELMSDGLWFEYGIIPTSLCCPSRSSLLTGLESGHTGVWTNSARSGYGGWPAFQSNESRTIAAALDRLGYTTGLFGKYLNGWDGATVPPGWDTFTAFKRVAYYDYTLAGTEPDESHGDTPADYSTDVITDKTVDFIKDQTGPYLAYYAPYASHAPFTPAPRHEGTLPLVAESDIPALNEKIMADKPAWVQRPEVSASRQTRVLTSARETLLAVDEGIQRIVRAAAGEPTIFVFLSDNGLMTGSHRLLSKDVPYDRSVRVPMAIRYDGVTSPGVSRRIMTNTDLTATILSWTGASLGRIDGIPLGQRRRGTVIEQTQNSTGTDGRHPSYCGWRSRRYLYVRYDKGQGAEFYDYRDDPEELRNGVARDRYATLVARYRQLAKEACSPLPPGFSW